MDRGAWQVIIHRVTESNMTEVTQHSTAPVIWGFLGGSDGKESSCNAGSSGLIPGSGRFPGEGTVYPSSILVWEILWTEKPGSYSPQGHRKSDTNQQLSMHVESGRSTGKGNGNPLKYSCLENPMDRGAWRTTVPGAVKSQILAQHSTAQHIHI